MAISSPFNQDPIGLRGMRFGKGGGSAPPPQPQTSTVNQSGLPEYAEPYFVDLLDKTQVETGRDYQAYEGQRIAGIGDTTQQGYDQMTNIAQSGTPQSFNTAEQAFAQQVDPNASAYGLQQQGPLDQQASFTDPGVAGQFMNPYITNVLDTQQARLTQRFGEDQLGRDASAVSAGAFSNSRRGVVDAIAQRELNMQRNELDAAGYASAYQTGADIFGQERDANLQTQGMNAEIFAGNQQRQLGQQQNILSAAGGLREQGLAGEQLETDRARMLAGVGGVYDDQTQAGLDVDYSDFLNQRDYPRQSLNFYSGILRGVPVTPTQESTTYAPPPNMASQLLGLGLGGLGLYNSIT